MDHETEDDEVGDKEENKSEEAPVVKRNGWGFGRHLVQVAATLIFCCLVVLSNNGRRETPSLKNYHNEKDYVVEEDKIGDHRVEPNRQTAFRN